MSKGMPHFTSVAFSVLFGLPVVAALLACIARFAGKAAHALRMGAAVGTVLAMAAGTVLAINAWAQGVPLHFDLSFFSPLPFLVSLDRLGGFFLFIVCGVSLPAVVFSFPYTEHHYPQPRAAWYWAFLPLFLLSMVMVVTGATVFAFFAGWELMTLLSAALIFLEGDGEERRRDIFLYLLTMHAGAALVLSAFLLFSPHAPSLDFASLRAAGLAMPAADKAAIFLLAFFGFATKAGIIPLHVWLPRAHPIAPTPVSALMSGIMLKTAVYAFVRFVFDFLSGGPAWGGYLVLAAGAVSAVLGILYAIFEPELKRLLAYSSVENIGIIYLAIGAAMLCRSSGVQVFAALALMAALIHSLNHAIFKNLLFLGAGAISFRTHSLRLNELGGLLKSMPTAGTVMLVGCVSIAGLPLFNGFVGEWLAFQSFLGGGQAAQPLPQLVLPLMAGVLALTGALAAACFASAYGAAFLGRPRKAEVPAAKVPLAMLLPLVVLAGACAVIGVFPMLALRPIWDLTATLVPGGDFQSVAPIAGGIQKVALITLAGAVAALVVRTVVRVAPTWACGLAGLTARMQYTATSFSKPIRTVFSPVYRADRKLEILPENRPYFPDSISYRSTRTLSYEKLLYRPVVDAIMATAQQLRRLQTGNIQWYLLYIFLALVAMLLLMRFR
jgi:hydrogenase-4 component B